MAKSNYLSGILFLAALCLCGCAGSHNLVVGCWLPVVREGESLKLKAKSTKSIVVGYQLPVVSRRTVALGSDLPKKMHKVMGFSMNEQNKNLQFQKHQNEVFLGVKSVFPATNNQQLTTKRIYDSQIGVHEQALNAGPEVEKYLRYVNLGRGQPWCAAFICWVYGQAGIENPRSGWSPKLFPLAKIIWSKAYAYPTRQITGNRQPDSYRVTTPRTGDIFALFFSEKNRIAHAGFIDQWGDTWLVTVEGNTNIEGSREGDGVYRKRRLVKSVYQVARYIGGR